MVNPILFRRKLIIVMYKSVKTKAIKTQKIYTKGN